MRGLTQLGGTSAQQIGTTQTTLLPTTVPAQTNGLDISSIMNMMIMLIVIVMMMRMMTKVTESV